MATAVTVSQPLPPFDDLVPLRILEEAGSRGLSNCLKTHFRRRDAKPSKRSARGFRSSGYWLEAADSVLSSASGGEIVARIPKEGVALHFFGGVVVPRRRKALAVPLSPVVGDFWPSEGAIPGVFAVKTAAGKMILARKKGDGIEPLWALVRRTSHRPDPSVLPPPEAMADAVVDAAEAALESIL